MGPQKRVHQRRRKHSRDQSQQRGWTCHWCLTVTLLYFLVSGAAAESLHGLKGDSITLTCSCTGENISLRLTSGAFTAYGARPDEQYKGRVHRIGHCSLMIQDLRIPDAGTYTFTIYDNSHPIPKLLYELIYDVIVSVTLTGRTGGELRFEDLPRGAERVVYSRETEAQRKDLWRRGTGVLGDRLTDREGPLVIRDFRASDAGVYTVLDAAGGILNTVMVSETKDEPNYISHDKTEELDNTTDHTEPRNWIFTVSSVVLLAVALIIALKKRQHRCRNTEYTPPKPESNGCEMHAVNQTNDLNQMNLQTVFISQPA